MTRFPIPALLAVVTLWPAAGTAAQDLAGATLICSFTQECFETAECTPTRHTVDVALPMAFPGDGSLLPETGPVEGEARLVGATLAVTAADDAGTVMTLARSSEGFARLSVLSGAPIEAMTYHGECRVAE